MDPSYGKRRVFLAVSLATCLILAETFVLAQKPGSPSPTTTQTPAQGGTAAPAGNANSASPSSASLQGISFSQDSWKQISVLPPPETYSLGKYDIGGFFWDDLQGHSYRKDVLIYCYDLKQNLSAAAPFLLEPTPAPDTEAKNDLIKVDPGKYELCSNQVTTLHRGVSLVMGRYLVFRIDMSSIPDDVRARIQTLNLNVTSAAGTPFNSQRGSSLNPSLVRPRMALLSGRPFPCIKGDPPKFEPPKYHPYHLNGKPLRDAFCPVEGNPLVEKPKVVYLAWPGPLVADTLPTISINLIYTPVAPALPWKKDTFYPAGSVVISDAHDQTNGHYYLAVRGGDSSPNDEPNFDTGLVKVPKFPDGPPGPTWQRIGPVCQLSTPAAGAAAPPTSPLSGLTLYQTGTLYSKGQLVEPPAPGNCHFYRAVVTGNAATVWSGNTAPAFATNGSTVPDAARSSLSWQDMGIISIPAWSAGTGYAEGAFVTASPTTGYFYKATAGGVSGTIQPAFPINAVDKVTESAGLVWLDAGPGATPPSSVKFLKEWTAETPYILGDGVLDRATGHYYVAIQPGVSGKLPGPPFELPGPPLTVPAPQVVADLAPLQWQDLGTTPPATASLGTQPADQTVSVLNLTLPQAHSLVWFNLASGVVVSSLRPSVVTTYTGVGPGMQSSPTNPDVCPTGVSTCSLYSVAKGSHLIDPVLGLTVYAVHPLDVERPFRLLDLIPAPTFNLSVLSPTANFHIGFSSEFFVRNLQLTYGGSFVQETRAPAGTPTATINNQPAYLSTVKKFNKGSFFGFTLNISGLINAATGLIP
jgi:hypothetical protein